MLSYTEIKENLFERKDLYPTVYHDIVPLQQLQFINSNMVKHDLPVRFTLDIMSLYEDIVSKLFKMDKKTGKNKPILFKGTERMVIIAHCIYKICTLNGVQCDEDKVRINMGISKARMMNIHTKYNLE